MSLQDFLFQYKYLSADAIKGFDSYKYSSKDTSPLSNYVMHPFWNWLIKFFPMWLAPNLMTFIGFLCLVFNFFLLLYFDPDLYASSIDVRSSSSIPHLTWLACAFLNFASHTLDGLDGKQARRTKTSSPVGELFDHGLDSWATLFFPLCAYSVFGRGMYGSDPISVFYVLLVVMSLFILSHWEKYITGVFFLPWGYDLSQIGLTGVYIATFLLGSGFWQGFVFGGWSYADVVALLVHLGFWVLSLPLTFLNVVMSYVRNENRGLPFVEVLRPLLSPMCLLTASLLWAHYSPNRLIYTSPRLFYAAFGTVFSNVSCRLIVAQMSQTRIQTTNLLAAVYCVLVSGVFILRPTLQNEYSALVLFVIFAVITHIHFGCSVVKQMLDHFNIRAFTIPSMKSRDD